MTIYSKSLRAVIALLLSITVAASLSRFEGSVSSASSRGLQQKDENLRAGTRISGVNAIASSRGVLLRWSTSYELDNAGFNIYREQAGQRERINSDIVLGSVFIVGQGVPLRSGYA